MKIIALLMLLVTSAGNAQDSRWVTVEHDSQISLLMDTTTIEKDVPLRAVWFRLIHAVPQRSEYVHGLVKTAMLHERIDCGTRRMAGLGTVAYDENGKVIHSYNHETSDVTFESPTPDTVGEMMVRYVCKAIP